ncbi:hypothetical protein C8R48DRAFT_780110 [Suillus tomentosus]|nr:hypothetical protein C8R48DRAFT_780110 [Suillus tomentosus]
MNSPSTASESSKYHCQAPREDDTDESEVERAEDRRKTSLIFILASSVHLTANDFSRVPCTVNSPLHLHAPITSTSPSILNRPFALRPSCIFLPLTCIQQRSCCLVNMATVHFRHPFSSLYSSAERSHNRLLSSLSMSLAYRQALIETVEAIESCLQISCFI